MKLNPNIIQKLGRKPVTRENNKINALELINTYRLLNGLSYTFKYSNTEKKVLPDKKILQDDGSFDDPGTTNTFFSHYASEYLTQQALIVASDIKEGETAYKRVKSSRAVALDKIKEDIESINIPEKVEVNLESIQAGNNTATIQLPVIGKNGSAITWSSSDELTISNDGIVTFPEKLSQKVTLTANAKIPYENNELEKSKKFTVEVDSKMLGIAAENLSERVEYFDNKYKDNISSLGYEGIVAYSEMGRNISELKVSELSDGNSVENYSKNIIQIVLSGNNPYNYNNTNYVEILKSKEENYNGNPIVSIALSFAGESQPKKLISDIVSNITTSSSISATTSSSIKAYSMSVNSLVMLDKSGKLGNITSSSAISMDDIKSDYISFAKDIQRQDGMFGDTVEEHSAVVYAMISLGEDLFSEEYVKDGNTVLSFIDSLNKDNLSAINILSNILSKNNIWIRTNLTETKYNELLNSAIVTAGMGEGKYSPSSLQQLNAVIEKAKKDAQDFGKLYFEIRDAINNLSTSMLPEFTDLGNFTKESSYRFLEKAGEFYNFVNSNKKSSVADAKKYAQGVADAYSVLESKGLNNKISAFALNDFNYGSNYITERNFSLGLGLTDSQKEAQRILEKTSKAYDEAYGYDVSSSYWGVFEVGAMGKDISKYKVYDVTKHKNGLLSVYQATDFAAIILQLVLTGENPYDYKGINYVDWLKKKEGIDSSAGKGDGNFGPYANNIWALMALGAVGEHNEKLVKTVTGMAKKGQYVDTEAWALAGLQNYKDEISPEDMSLIIKNFHDKMESAAGDKWTIGNAFTHGCVISGLVAAGEDLTSDKWTKNGINMLTSLETVYQTEDGRFRIGEYMEPAFVKDAIIGLGDAAQGSNVWQRTYLDKNKINAAIVKAKDALANVSEQVPEYKKSALEAAVSAVEQITEINGNGYKYFRLLEAIEDLSDMEIVQFTGKESYTEDSFMQFENAVKASAAILLKSKAKAYDLNEGCKNILLMYELLKEKQTDPGPVNPGKNNITVSFKLLGAVKHDGNGTKQTLKQGNLQTWIPSTKVTVSEGSKVYDVFTRVLDENGYSYIGAENNYVSSIIKPNGEVLGEFSNGQLSGWMYTVNGKHPNVGLRAYTLSDGDSIVWHYTDDYTIEEGSEKWNKAETGAIKNNLGIVLELSAGKDNNGVATSNLSSAQIKSLQDEIKKLGSNESSAIILNVITEKDAKGLKLTVPTDLIKTLKDNDKVSLDIKSDSWGVSISTDALKHIITEFGTKDITISFVETKIDNLTEKTKLLVGERKIYDINIYSDNKKVDSFGGKTISLYIPYDAKNEDAKKLSVYKIKDNGEIELIDASKYNDSKKIFEFKVYSLSKYTVGYNNGTVADIQFNDVSNDDWFYESVMYAVEKSLFTGTSENTFSPNMPMTRAMLVTVLHRLEGKPVSTKEASFRDLLAGQWYTDAVNWSAEKEVVKGITEIEFKPENNITREQLALMLYRYASTKNMVLGETGNIDSFTDKDKVSIWSGTAVKWAVGKGIITGRPDNSLDPTGTATRAEVAAMLQRYIENVK